jgi:hypothetical protein
MSKKEKVCLDKGQMENIIDAAREEPGSCPTAITWLEGFRPKKDDHMLIKILDKQFNRKAQSVIRKFKRLF